VEGRFGVGDRIYGMVFWKADWDNLFSIRILVPFFAKCRLRL